MFLENTYDRYVDKHWLLVTMISEDFNSFSTPYSSRLKYNVITVTRILQL